MVNVGIVDDSVIAIVVVVCDEDVERLNCEYDGVIV